MLRSVAGALVLLSIPGLICVAVYFWLFPYFDDAAPGSLKWYLVLPGYLTSAPTPAACGEPRYALHFIDGLKPGEPTVEFRTRASAAGVQTAYARELAACRPDSDAADGWSFQCARSQYGRIFLSLDPGEGCRRARITFLFY